jgi:hypothetical protein
MKWGLRFCVWFRFQALLTRIHIRLTERFKEASLRRLRVFVTV